MSERAINTGNDLAADLDEHSIIDDWLKGDGIDRALKAMNKSASSKKPGHVGKRLAKTLANGFRSPRVISWERGLKNVYTAALSRGYIEDVVLTSGLTQPCGLAVFQTDLYFRSNDEVTEVNASTVSAICTSAIDKLKGIPGDEDLAVRMRTALTLARIVQTGLRDESAAPEDVRQYIVPIQDAAMLVASMPIERIEFEKGIVGRVAVIIDIIPSDKIGNEDRQYLEKLKQALTKEGHPGEEKFVEIIESGARPATGKWEA